MKKVISILLLSIFILQTTSIGVISIIFSQKITIKQLNSSTTCNEEDICKGLKSNGMAEPVSSGFLFPDAVPNINKLRGITAESFLANHYFEITVPPPNPLA